MAQRRSRRSSRPEESQPRSEYWRAQSVAWQTSGMTQADFCEEHELSLPALRWWRWKLKREDGESEPSTAPEKDSGRAMRLVPVRVVDPEPHHPTPSSCSTSAVPPLAFEVVLESGATIRMPRDFDAEALSRLLRTLEAVGC